MFESGDVFEGGGVADDGAAAARGRALVGDEVRDGVSLLEVGFASLVAGVLDVGRADWGRHGSCPVDSGEDDAGQADREVDAGPVKGGGGDAGQADREVDAGPGDGVKGADGAGLGGLDAVVLAKAAGLVGADLSGASDDVLVDAVVAWQHVVSWAVAAQARVVDELVARSGGSSRAVEGVTHELSAALVSSRHAAGALVGRAVGLGQVPAVADALTDGRIDVARADALLAGGTVPVGVRDRVATELVGTAEVPGPASGLTPRQLRDRLRRAAIEADPGGSAVRAEKAATERGVWIDPAPDQMAWLTALLPAADAARVWARVDETARRGVRLPGEARTLGQLRADALTDLVTTREASTTTGPTTTGSAATGSAAAGGSSVSVVGAVVNVTVSATTLLGLDDAPALLGGYGPVPAAVARVLAAGGDATWRRIVTDPVTGAATDVSRTGYRPGVVLGDLVRTRDPVCTFPGCHVPAARCDLDHVDPFDPARDTRGQTRASNLHPVCRAHHNAKTHGGWSTRAGGDAGGGDSGGGDGTIVWTSPTGREYVVPPNPTDPSRPPGAVTRRTASAGSGGAGSERTGAPSAGPTPSGPGGVGPTGVGLTASTPKDPDDPPF
ncbi:DUF222 domain-containing protein [Luteimicrobium sp. DT211]|uniref:HNH endonuclease signature motif containing protein n=1 Tax=Luteimicrobium sp. DT211 TaxID=3393412 RepID=UPI003CF6413B